MNVVVIERVFGCHRRTKETELREKTRNVGRYGSRVRKTFLEGDEQTSGETGYIGVYSSTRPSLFSFLESKFRKNKKLKICSIHSNGTSEGI